MKKLKLFLEKNYKKITTILILLWFYLIIKLWLFWANFICWSSWYISICIIPDFEYTWTNAWYVSVCFLILSIILFIPLLNTKDKIKKISISLVILFMWLIWKSLFYLISPDFKFYENGEKSYSDKDWNVTDMDKYLESMWKYCDNSKDDFKMRWLRRSDWCSWQYLYDYKTAEEYAKVFDYANKHNLDHLYKLTFRSANDFWLEKIIKVYHDDTFYAYLINYIRTYEIIIIKNDNYILELIVDKSNNNSIKNLWINFIDNISLIDDKHNVLKWEDEKKYWENIHKELRMKIKQIPEVNYKVF
jgi:hypothetical protein